MNSRLLMVAGSLCRGVLALIVVPSALAAPIPGLFNTGVAADSTLLPPSGGAVTAVDPHYQVIESADPAYPASIEAPASAVTLVPGFPVGPWLAEGPLSKWISLNRLSGNVIEGNYTFRTTFNLTGFDPTKARIEGKWSVDNQGIDILLNGTPLGLSNNAGFGGFTDFTIDAGFVPGVNTLDFILFNAPAGANPAGLRVEMNGTVELPNEPPSIRSQPTGATVGEGDPYTLVVSADGTPPLAFQWKRNGQILPGATANTLEFFAATPDDTGEYTVVVSNATATAATSNPAILQVLSFASDVILFATGVDDTGNPLPNLDPDTHYRITVNPDSSFDPGNPETAYAVDETLWPIVVGPWLANSGTSRWIGPRPDVGAAAGGDYTYRLSFTVNGRDVTKMLLRGDWSTDNAGLDIRINGVPSGQTNGAQFGGFTPFSVTTGFISGVNNIDFVLNNAGAGPTALRVENLSLFAPIGSAPGTPRILSQPTGKTALVGENVGFSVLADGQAPLAYRWRKNGAPIDGATESTYTLSSVQPGDEAEYTVVVSNALSSVTSTGARIKVLFPIPGFFNTGVDAAGQLLNDLDIDPHYTLIANANDPAVSDALAMTGLPAPPWVANSDTSRWIGPTGNTSAAEGDYTYRLSVDLTGFDPASIEVSGQYTCDDAGSDILLNGVSLGLVNTTQFTSLTPFVINSGFKTGVNTFDFLVNNASPSPNPTGLRIEGLRAGGLRAAVVPTLSITRTSGTEVTLSWPDPSTGWRLFTSPTLLPGSWTAAPQVPLVIDGKKTLTVTATGTDYYRLQLP